MPNPNTHVATIKISRVAGGTEIFLRSAIIEEKIKRDAGAGPSMTREVNARPSWWPIAYKMYRVELPDFNGNYLISPDPLEETRIESFLHLVRVVGLKKGVKVIVPKPMSVSATQTMAKRFSDYLKFVYEEYYTDITVEYTLKQKVAAGVETSGSL